MAIFGANGNFSLPPGRNDDPSRASAGGFGAIFPRHDVGGFVTNVGITFELEELIPGSESRVALGYAGGYSRPQPVPLQVTAWQLRTRNDTVAGRQR